MQPKAATTVAFAQHTHTEHTPFGGRTPSRIIYAHILCIFPNVAHFAFPSFLRRICIPFLLTHSQCRPMPKTQNRFAPESMQQSVKHAKGRHTDWCFNPKTTRPLTHKRLSLTHTRIRYVCVCVTGCMADIAYTPC